MKFMKKIFIILTVAIALANITAQNYYWDGGGSDNLWSNSQNWAIKSGSVYIDPTSAPNSYTAIVYFDGGSTAGGGANAFKNCSIDLSINTSWIVIYNYNGTISPTKAITINIGAEFAMFSGNFDMSGFPTNFYAPNKTVRTYNTANFILGSGNIITGNFNIFGGNVNLGSSNANIYFSLNQTGGTFTSTSGTLSLRNNLSVTGTGTIFNNNNGTISLLSSSVSSQTITHDVNLVRLYNLTFDNNFSGSTAQTYTLNNNIFVDNNLTFINGSSGSTRRSVLNNNNIFLAGNLIVQGSSTYTTNTNAGTTVINMSGSGKTITTNCTSAKVRNIPNLLISSTASVTQVGNLGVAGIFTNNGTYTASVDTLSMSGNFINNGTLTTNYLKFNGSGTQTIGGASQALFNNISIEKTGSSQLQLSAATQITGRLNISNGTSVFNTNGNTFTLLSTASQTASIGKVYTGSSISGNITVQRYIPARAGRYYYQIGSPVSGAAYTQIQTNATGTPPNPDNGIFITGTAISGTNADINSIGLKNTNVPSIKTFDANTAAVTNPTSTSDIMTSGSGFEAFIRDGSATFAPSTGAKLLTFTGSVITGNFNYSLGYNATSGTVSGGPVGGWNLISNPYACDITASFNSAGWSTGSANLIDNTVYQYDPDAKAFITCLNGVGSTGSTGNSATRACIISATQAFQIRTTAPGTLTVNENAKIVPASYGSGQSILRTSNEEKPLLLNLTNTNTGISNGTVIMFDENSTEAYDKNKDAIYLPSNEPFVSLATEINENTFAINALPSSFNGVINLKTSYPKGTNTFSLDKPDSEIKYQLYDSKLGKFSDLNEKYVFESESDEIYTNRFSLRISSTTESTNEVSIYPNPNSSEYIFIETNIGNNEKAIIEISDLSGQVVFKKTDITENKIIIDNTFEKGVYLVTFKTSKGLNTKKLAIK